MDKAGCWRASFGEFVIVIFLREL